MFRGPLTVLLLRLGTVGLVYSLLRVLFWLYNRELFPDPPLLAFTGGGLRFDASARIAWLNLPCGAGQSWSRRSPAHACSAACWPGSSSAINARGPVLCNCVDLGVLQVQPQALHGGLPADPHRGRRHRQPGPGLRCATTGTSAWCTWAAWRYAGPGSSTGPPSSDGNPDALARARLAGAGIAIAALRGTGFARWPSADPLAGWIGGPLRSGHVRCPWC
jgi:hypothetical protein